MDIFKDKTVTNNNSSPEKSVPSSGEHKTPAPSSHTSAGDWNKARASATHKHQKPKVLENDLQKILEARHHDPFAVLGKHTTENSSRIRVFIPRAKTVKLVDIDQAMTRIGDSDLFEWQGTSAQLPRYCRLQYIDDQNNVVTQYDTYSFLPQLSDYDLHLFGEGKHWHVYRVLGAHPYSIDGIEGVLFATWAPNAERISVIGNFNRWDGRCHPMRNRGSSGVWELFIPHLKPGELYKFEIRARNGEILEKTDPYGQHFEMRPKTAAIVESRESTYEWNDSNWLDNRKTDQWQSTPLSIYEVHLGSWRRDNSGNFLDYKTAAHQLVDYVKALGFTHIQLLPITEHPFDGSWGYQCTGYFAPTSRFGTPDDFRYFVDHCHQNNIGVLLDWAPGHFPKDMHALARFDGTALYEHEDPRRGEHRDWGTLIYNYGRNEVRNFLLASAVYWMNEFHIDGLRVDAVASMLYLDYSREADDWVPNIYGGNENLEAIDFIRELNAVIHGEFPGAVMIAEESTAWPQVTRPTWLGGLGFSMKWNMGWMHDTLTYFQKDPIHRLYHHDQLTFGLLYAFTENFVLPLSHDEVVHGKSSILNKMPGDEWQKFANVRLLYTFMFTYPGKKILFMGNEFCQGQEWSCDKTLDWYVLDYAFHLGIKNIVRDLNQLYTQSPELYSHDFNSDGFEWIDGHDAAQSIISFIRKDNDSFYILIFNFTPVPRLNYRIGVPRPGIYAEIFNSDSEYYQGSNVGNLGELHTEQKPWMNREQSLNVTVPPLAGIVLKLQEN